MEEVHISLIIPTVNRADLLKQSLESISVQTTREKFEVIIVDNGSTDHTKEVCALFLKNFRNFFYYYQPEPGLLTGRHFGFEMAKGAILVFLDDDVVLNKDYVNGVVKVFADNRVQLATGPSLPLYHEPPPAWLENFWVNIPEGKFCTWLSLLDLGDRQLKIESGFVWGLNFCIRKTAMIELGGFHPDCIPAKLQKFQGDGETGLTTKASLRGYESVYDPALTLHHQVTKERLAIGYFEIRAFYQGVCNSYSSLRQNTFKKAPENEEVNIILFKKIRNFLHPYYRWVKTLRPKTVIKQVEDSPAIIEMKAQLLKIEREGFEFHQQAFRSEIAVRNWVLKENYWDYKLPKYD